MSHGILVYLDTQRTCELRLRWEDASFSLAGARGGEILHELEKHLKTSPDIDLKWLVRFPIATAQEFDSVGLDPRSRTELELAKLGVEIELQDGASHFEGASIVIRDEFDDKTIFESKVRRAFPMVFAH